MTDADANSGYWVTTGIQGHYGALVESDNYSTNVGGVYLQENTPWDYTPLEPDYLHRGVRQNRLLGEYFCFGGDCDYLGDQRNDYVDLVPYPVEIIP